MSARRPRPWRCCRVCRAFGAFCAGPRRSFGGTRLEFVDGLRRRHRVPPEDAGWRLARTSVHECHNANATAEVASEPVRSREHSSGRAVVVRTPEQRSARRRERRRCVVSSGRSLERPKRRYARVRTRPHRALGPTLRGFDDRKDAASSDLLERGVESPQQSGAGTGVVAWLLHTGCRRGLNPRSHRSG